MNVIADIIAKILLLVQSIDIGCNIFWIKSMMQNID